MLCWKCGSDDLVDYYGQVQKICNECSSLTPSWVQLGDLGSVKDCQEAGAKVFEDTWTYAPDELTIQSDGPSIFVDGNTFEWFVYEGGSRGQKYELVESGQAQSLVGAMYQSVQGR